MLAAIAVALRLKFNLVQPGAQRDIHRRRHFAFAANLSVLRARRDPPSPDTFPSFLSEVGQQSENDITIAAARCLTDLRRGKSAFSESHLGRRACELRCACFDAAMHFKKIGNLLRSEKRESQIAKCAMIVTWSAF
jgi:hypothetical protein